MVDQAPVPGRWFWIELIGFDLNLPDCGVGLLLGRAGFVPEAVSLLLGNPEFVHRHAGPDGRRPFPPDVCSYGGHPRNEERARQDWTPADLCRLVRALQRRKIRVYFSVFTVGTPDGWLGQHPEVTYVPFDGSAFPHICPWKRLADGSYYEDFFARQLGRVMRDYGFDGFHGADGYAHPKLPLCEGDFSDDMVGQFLEEAGLTLSREIPAACDGKARAIARRAAWIWAHRRAAWIGFHVRRTQRFWRKIATVVHARKKQLVLNTCWTRDPFEAISRFGVDYRALAEAGADAFLVEAAGAVQEMGGDLPYGTAHGQSWTGWDPTRILCRFQTTIMLIKAAAPRTKLVFLNGVKDTHEAWNGISHAPTNLESEIYLHGNVFIRKSKDRLERCVRGPVVCLADGLRPDDWRWLREAYEHAFEFPAQRVLGATVLWSDTALQRQADDSIATQRCPTGRLLHELVVRGAPLYTIMRVADLAKTTEPLVVLHPHLYAKAELDRVFACARGPLFLIGGRVRSIPAPAFQFGDARHDLALWCAAWRVGRVRPAPAATARRLARPVDWRAEPPAWRYAWIYEMPARPVSAGFLENCATTISAAAAAPCVLENAESVRVWACQGRARGLRLFLRNEDFYYRVAYVDVRRGIRSIQVRTRFPGSPVPFEGSRFHVKIPGKGTVILDVQTGQVASEFDLTKPINSSARAKARPVTVSAAP